MRSRIKITLGRVKYAAIGAAIGAALGGLVNRNAASTGGAVGGLVGATLGETRVNAESTYTQLKGKVQREPVSDSAGRADIRRLLPSNRTS